MEMLFRYINYSLLLLLLLLLLLQHIVRSMDGLRPLNLL